MSPTRHSHRRSCGRAPGPALPTLRSGRGRAAVRTALGVVVALALLPATSARAQAPASATLTLKRQPVYYGPHSRLGLSLEVTNEGTEPLAGFTLTVGLAPRVTSRSALHDSFDGGPGLTISATSFQVADELAPGTGRVVPVNERLDRRLLPSAVLEDGVYPLTISLLDAGGALLDEVTTQFLYYHRSLDNRLNLTVVVPFNHVPARTPDGSFDFGGAAPGASLVDALAPEGSLSTTLDVLEKLARRRLRFGLAPTPRLLEEVSDLSDGYRDTTQEEVREVGPNSPEAENAASWLERFEALVETRGVQTLLVPYAWPDLPALERHLIRGQEHIAAQLTRAEDVLAEVLGVELARDWILPPAGRLDAATLAALKGIGGGTGDRLIVSDRSLVGVPDPSLAGCPDPSLSFTCPVSVPTPADATGGATVGYVTDRDVQERLAGLERTEDARARVDLQRFFAETALIREEQPGVEGRVLAVTIPDGWHPSGRMALRLYRGLAGAPWLRTVTPRAGLRLGVEPATRTIVDSLPSAPNQLGAADYAGIESAQDAVESFGYVKPPAALVERLSSNILVAESRSFWKDPPTAARGLAYASAARGQVLAELGKISINVQPQVTLTSRRGSIPILINNRASYPVRVVISLESTKLDPHPSSITRVFEPGQTPDKIDVTAQSSGIFPLSISLSTPGPDPVPIQTIEPSVRSTEFNDIAVAITTGALAFLVLFYVMRWYRRRNDSPGEKDPQPA